jgi:hypothetical protein
METSSASTKSLLLIVFYVKTSVNKKSVEQNLKIIFLTSQNSFNNKIEQ